MELMEAIAGRRSIRKFTDEPLPEDDLRSIMDAAVMAPSAKNLQPWHFVVLKSKESVERFRAIIAAAEENRKSTRKQLEERFARNPEVVEETMSFLYNLGGAPCIILAFEYAPSYRDDWIYDVSESVAAALENAILAAYEKGIASCWVNAMLSLSDEFRQEFAPDHGRMLAAVAMGYPAEQPKREIRRKDGRVVFK